MDRLGSNLQRQITSQAEAEVVAALETAQLRTVTTRDIEAMMELSRGSQTAIGLVRQMREHGWLRSLPLRGTYEFQPAIGGPFPSGDAWLELRVALTTHPHARAHVGIGSAAFMRSLADRRPPRDTIVWRRDVPTPRGLRTVYQVVECMPDRYFGTDEVDGVPVASVSRIALEVALWPLYAGDLRNPDHWLRTVFQHVDQRELLQGAIQLGPTLTTRLGYLASAFGAAEIAEALASLPHTRPVWLGRRREAAKRYDTLWGLYDTIGVAAAR